MRREDRTRGGRRRGRRPAFTLVELLMVITIIAILLALILTAAMGGIRQAEERASQALIVKLDAGLADRVDALLSTRSDYTPADYYMAWVVINGYPPIPSIQRAQIIARFDQVKAELPDVFVAQTSDTNYPINFAGVPYPGTPVSGALAGTSATGYAYGQYLLPLGAGVYNDGSTTFGSYSSTATTAPYSTGIFGASYTAAGGLYKNLVAQAVLNGATAPSPINRGYDGVDNDGNGLVDDLSENGASVKAGILSLLAKHTHKTARAEMLYALLVEGQGPLGSVFSRDDFSDREIRDTDGDGLPEFVDAWGEPIQFYRWPVFFVDDLQKHGGNTYINAFDSRELNPLDSNQLLLNPAWWAGGNPNANSIGTAASPLSAPAALFQSMFTSLTDPNFPNASKLGPGQLWDRGGGSARRAFFSKFLILSGGPDKTPGVPVLDANYYNNVGQYLSSSMPGVPVVGVGGAGLGSTYTMFNLLCEDQAAQGSPNRTDQVYMGPSTTAADSSLSTAIQEAGNDDITSHSVTGTGGAIH